MISFFLSLIALIVGYLIYGKIVEKMFGADETKETPAIRLQDGVDFVPMPAWKIFMIQFLNIAGLGPIFGAIAGALWGPAAFLWIVLGSIFAGGVHDYFSGMLSVRHDGASIPEVVGKYLGPGFKQFMRGFSVILLILTGVVFIIGPAGLLNTLTGYDKVIWIYVIFIYYVLATMLPVDKIIGKIYPIFGLCLLIMAIGVAVGLIIQGYNIPEVTLKNLHPNNLPIWPLMFVTIACGAISGFHSTQSPLMARCITNEKQGRQIFYGAMIAEGILALIWAAAAMTFFGNTGELGKQMTAHGGQAWVVNTISNSLLGKIGGALAILGVVACPITSGDTAFRSSRLIIADLLDYEQGPIKNRLAISIPLFIIGFALTKINFDIVWRYFAWSNQTLAMIVLWTAASYLHKINKSHWMATIPAVFMTAVSITYILVAPEGFKLSTSIGYPIGIIVALVVLTLFLKKTSSRKSNIGIAK
ncbi:carbon starvation CstA family protein [Clostridium tepidum]|uniref:Carbon starvation protein A n=1 Tax=Clostridium tepidum TaxID=1962263 RepID=A0A1S9I5V7_9CLOT|nr:carbon starvation protein A [Clostridium tepidum]MCR1934294.1 carbon starvation protein A [Clostridium tepidum]MDU6877960.1 carbon starvation protein A [Clostridium botulinum]OOO62277.1 carbon starvation protein A [Clostridium tepidum]OOO65727.1 carbon starvation protein A [Clostridium tepidum]